MSCEGWKTVKLGDLGKIITGKTPKTSIKENYNGNILFLTPSDNMKQKHIYKTKKSITQIGLSEVKNCLLPSSSVCVSCIGSNLGKVVLTTKPTVTNQQINSIIPNNYCDSNYLYYAMILLGEKLNFISKTSTAVPIVNKTSFSNYKITLPPLPEQKAISSVLSVLDDKIELNNKINKNLEEMAQAIYKSWFVDFEPFQDGEFVDSKLGRIPKGWRVGKFTDVVKLLSGGTPKTSKSEFWDGDIPFFTPKDVSTGVYTINTEKKLTTLGLDNCNSILFPRNTIFVTARGTVGKVALAGSKMAMNQSCYALTQNKEDVSQLFVYHLTLNTVNALKHKANGAVFNAIVKRDFESENIVIPNNNLILKYTKIVEPIYTQILSYTEENTLLAQLRDALLPKLMSGEISVPVEVK